MKLTYKDFFDDNYTREEARATELAEQAAAAEKKQIDDSTKTKITVRGDWVDYCHFARDRYPEVFKAYKAATAKVSSIGFTDKPNPYSDLLTKTFEEMGYKVNWIYEEWVNPNKEQKKEVAAAAETAAEPKKQEIPHYEFGELDDNKNKTKRQTELAEKYRGDKEITELLSI